MYAQWMKCSGHELRNAQKDKIAIFREKYLDNKRRQYCDLCQAIYELKTSQYSKCCFPRIKIPHGREHIKKHAEVVVKHIAILPSPGKSSL